MELQTAKSKVNAEFEFDQNNWVISVFNSVQGTTNKLFGHAVILVEGLEPNKNSSLYPKLFIGQYDIQAEVERTEESFESISNRKGIISEIRIYQGDKYLNNKKYNDKFYKECQSRSFVVSKYNVLNMIESIEQDKETTDLAEKGEGEHLKYQQYGSKGGILQALFSEKDQGVNCAEWCIEKLMIAKVPSIENDTPKPYFVSGGCSIL